MTSGSSIDSKTTMTKTELVQVYKILDDCDRILNDDSQEFTDDQKYAALIELESTMEYLTQEFRKMTADKVIQLY